MADIEDSSSSEDSEGPSTSRSSEALLEICSAEVGPSNQDPEANSSTSSSRPASRKKVKTQNSAKLNRQPENPSATETCRGPSADSSVKSKLPMPKIDLKALFDYHSRMKQQRKRRRPRTEVAAELKSSEPCAKRPWLVVSKEEQRRRYRERHFQFPFVKKLYRRKHIPLKMECLFEEAALRGFFKYIEMLKYEDHLKKALMQLDAADDLERECLESRKHKYLDDNGPLSPIEETDGEDPNENCDTEDIGAKIVENSCFILSSNIPKKKKKKSKMMSKLPGKMASVHNNSAWKQRMKESSLCACLLDRPRYLHNPVCFAENLSPKESVDLITARKFTMLSGEAFMEQAATDGSK